MESTDGTATEKKGTRVYCQSSGCTKEAPEMESRKSKIDTPICLDKRLKVIWPSFFFSFFITIIISIFIPSFVINKNRYIVVWAAAWRQTNRQASNYSSNSSSSSNSRVVIIGSGIMCTCVACNLCSECVYMYARVFRFLRASISTRAELTRNFRYTGRNSQVHRSLCSSLFMFSM